MIFRHLLNMRSHPTWVRGLKQGGMNIGAGALGSHPTWVRGLKRAIWESTKYFGVAPYVGAWIETLTTERVLTISFVAPYVGAWIETNK